MLWARWPIVSAESVDIIQKKATASGPTLDYVDRWVKPAGLGSEDVNYISLVHILHDSYM